MFYVIYLLIGVIVLAAKLYIKRAWINKVTAFYSEHPLRCILSALVFILAWPVEFMLIAKRRYNL